MPRRPRDESFLRKRLLERAESGALRALDNREGLIDFSSNDYLGLARSPGVRGDAGGERVGRLAWGSTGSRLLSGNSELHERVEAELALFYGAEAALVFNSGYAANLGLMSCIPTRSDMVVYDELSHASIRDGVRLGLARSFSFRHNDVSDLGAKLGAPSNDDGERFVVVESLYSVDGDRAPLKEIANLCAARGAHLIVDEAHATGVFGPSGRGLVAAVGLEDLVFACLHTFGKALGSHGAAVVGSEALRQTLINFARSFIYTTALPPDSMEHIRLAHEACGRCDSERRELFRLIEHFHERIRGAGIAGCVPQQGPIQIVGVVGNARARLAGQALRDEGLDVRPILAPTVRPGHERLRVCLHSFNTTEQIDRLVACLERSLAHASAAEIGP